MTDRLIITQGYLIGYLLDITTISCMFGFSFVVSFQINWKIFRNSSEYYFQWKWISGLHSAIVSEH